MTARFWLIPEKRAVIDRAYSSLLVFVFFFLWRLDLNLGLLQNIRIQLCEFVSADGHYTLAALETFRDLRIRAVADSQRHALLLRLVLRVYDDDRCVSGRTGQYGSLRNNEGVRLGLRDHLDAH